MAVAGAGGKEAITETFTQGEIEAALGEGVSRFMQEFMGRGPKSVRVHLLADLVVVRLQGVLTAAEQHLALALPGDKGRDLLKSVRTHLIETSRTRLETMVEQASGIGCVSMHHDVSTVTGEEVFLFTLVAIPKLRPQTARKPA